MGRGLQCQMCQRHKNHLRGKGGLSAAYLQALVSRLTAQYDLLSPHVSVPLPLPHQSTRSRSLHVPSNVQANSSKKYLREQTSHNFPLISFFISHEICLSVLCDWLLSNTCTFFHIVLDLPWALHSLLFHIPFQIYSAL